MVALKMLKKGNIIDNDERESILAERNVFALIASEGGYPFLVNCHGVYQTKVSACPRLIWGSLTCLAGLSIIRRDWYL